MAMKVIDERANSRPRLRTLSIGDGIWYDGRPYIVYIMNNSGPVVGVVEVKTGRFVELQAETLVERVDLTLTIESYKPAAEEPAREEGEVVDYTDYSKDVLGEPD